MTEARVTITIPWQPPQALSVRQVARDLWLTELEDRYGRRVRFAGREVGFGVRLFESTDFFRLSRLVVLGDWERVLYRGDGGGQVEVVVTRHAV